MWHDVRGASGEPMVFTTKEDARKKLEEQFPVMVKMEQYGGGKRTRVIAILNG